MTTLDQIGAETTGNSDELPPFLSAEQKQEIAESQHPFWVVGGVPVQTGKYEPQSFYHIRFGNPEKMKTVKTALGVDITVTRPGWAANSEVWTLALSVDQKEERPAQVRKIVHALTDPETPAIGPCFLYGKETKSGNTFWKVTGTRTDQHKASNGGSSASTSTQPARDKAPEPVEDSDIPFHHDDTFMVTL